jgi:sulfate adenylyltransferase
MKISLRDDQYLEVEKLSDGVFFPLVEFMSKEEVDSVAETMTLPSGEVFSLPVLFDITKEQANELGGKDTILLYYQNELVANLHVNTVFSIDKEKYLVPFFKTDETVHPGVHDFMSMGEFFISGKVEMIKKATFSFSKNELSPVETKAFFKKMGWKTIVGFQTRNIPHRAHEYLQKVALETVDGIFIQPLVGKKKKGDFTPDAVIKGYEALIEHYYPKDRFLLGILTTKMRYAGPREAVFHAMIRKNYGCTHFIVGRDHAGVGGYYEKYEAHELISKVESKLGIKVLTLCGPYYCSKCDGIVTEKTCPHIDNNGYAHQISGSFIRESLQKDAVINEKFIRNEVISALEGITCFIP